MGWETQLLTADLLPILPPFLHTEKYCLLSQLSTECHAEMTWLKGIWLNLHQWVLTEIFLRFNVWIILEELEEGGECGIHYFSTKNSTSESKVASGSLSSCPDMGSQHSQQLFPSYRCLESKGDQWKNPQNPSDFLTISLPNLGWLTKNNYHFQGSLLLSGYLQNLVLKIVHK